MSSLKVRMAEIIQEQPEDATYEEIIRELAFERMVERGLADSRTGRVISNEEMARRIRTWHRRPLSFQSALMVGRRDAFRWNLKGNGQVTGISAQ